MCRYQDEESNLELTKSYDPILRSSRGPVRHKSPVQLKGGSNNRRLAKYTKGRSSLCLSSRVGKDSLKNLWGFDC